MTFKRIVPVLLLLLVLVSATYAAPPKYLELTIVTTNDLHAHDVPFDVRGDPTKNIPDQKSLGGMARIATIIKKTREEARSPVLLFDSGDTTHGYTALPKAFHGASTIAIMNALKFQAMVPGNHDFQWHATDALRNKADSEFPWLCANITYPDGKLYGEPYIILDVGGVRVAAFGVTNEWPVTQSNVYLTGADLELKYLDATEAAARLVPELRQKADIVILLSHLGRTADEALAKAVPGIDIILGGHSHSRLSTPRMVAVGQPGGTRLGMVPVVQAYMHGMDIGRTRLIFRCDDSGEYSLMSCKGELVRINATIPDDPEIASLIKEWQKRIPPPAPPKPAMPAPAPAK